mgnify:CR=1 FL=1
MKIIHNFIDENARVKTLDWVNTTDFKRLSHEKDASANISKELNGFTALFDFNHSYLSQYISQFHGDYVKDKPNEILVSLKDKISETLKVSQESSYVQVIVLNAGGEVIPHYDASVNGYVNYKCNVVLDGPEDDYIYVNKDAHIINNSDLYCFEASLFKHWAKPVNCKRVVLSFGFLLPYADLGWSENDPRVKMSNRIMNQIVK